MPHKMAQRGIKLSRKWGTLIHHFTSIWRLNLELWRSVSNKFSQQQWLHHHPGGLPPFIATLLSIFRGKPLVVSVVGKTVIKFAQVVFVEDPSRRVVDSAGIGSGKYLWVRQRRWWWWWMDLGRSGNLAQLFSTLNYLITVKYTFRWWLMMLPSGGQPANPSFV